MFNRSQVKLYLSLQANPGALAMCHAQSHVPLQFGLGWVTPSTVQGALEVWPPHLNCRFLLTWIGRGIA